VPIERRLVPILQTHEEQAPQQVSAEARAAIQILGVPQRMGCVAVQQQWPIRVEQSHLQGRCTGGAAGMLPPMHQLVMHEAE